MIGSCKEILVSDESYNMLRYLNTELRVSVRSHRRMDFEYRQCPTRLEALLNVFNFW